MSIKLVEADTVLKKKIVNDIIDNNHTYVPTHRSVGRRIDWIIYDVKDESYPIDEEIIGMIGIGSSVYPPPKDILTYLKLTKNEYKSVFNNLCNNWRYCLISKGGKNVGTMILRKMRELAPIVWKRKYGDDLYYCLTFIGGGKDGGVYKADNWEMIGYTSGLPSKRKAVSMKWNTKEELKTQFVKPTGENKKMIFIIPLIKKHKINLTKKTVPAKPNLQKTTDVVDTSLYVYPTVNNH